MYFASVDERPVISYFFELQVTAPEPKEKRFPDVLLLSSSEPPQALSEFPVSLKSEIFSYSIPY